MSHRQPRSHPTHRIIRGIRYTRLSLHIVQGLASVGLIYPRVSARTRQRLTREWSAKLLRILNISLTVDGGDWLAHTDKLVVVANHVSWLDIFSVNAAQPSRFVAKSEIRQWPIVGWLCEKAGTIFVHRAKRSDTTRINAAIHDALDATDTVALFPEGTTTTGDRLLKFHTALFEPAVANRATIATIAIRYRDSEGRPSLAASFTGETSFAESLAQIIQQKSLIVELRVGAPLSTATTDAQPLSRREIAQQAEARIAELLGVPLPQTHQRFHEGATSVAGGENLSG